MTVDKAVEEVLGRASELTVIRNTEGRIIGRYMPIDPATQALYDEARKHFDPEELKRRKDSNRGGYTLAEIMEHLKSLETP